VSSSLLIGLILLAGGIFALWLRRRRNGNSEVDTIDVVATRAFGGKHKLALIETCGDRLLVAASDKDVKLLSRVGDAGAAGEKGHKSFEQALASQESDDASLFAGVGSVPPIDADDDLAGLMRLRNGRRRNRYGGGVLA